VGYDAIMRFPRAAAVVICFFSALSARAQPLNGNATLRGAYSVRYLGVEGYPCDCAVSFSGTFTFDGNGAFQVAGQGTWHNATDQVLAPLSSGTYTVWANGVVNLTNPFAPANSGTVLYGGVGQGAIVASSTDTQYLDLFVAIPAAAAAANSTLSGTYEIAGLEFAGGAFSSTRNTFSLMTADGKGGLGNVSITGTSTNLNGTPAAQTSAGATYTVTANGSGTLNFPAPAGVSTANQLLTGNKTLYVSADGNLFIAGSPSGYDFEIGIKQPAGNSPSTLQGNYFTANLENYVNGGQNAGLYAYDGSFFETGDAAGDELDHLRTNIDGYFSAGYYSFDETFNENLTVNPSGYATDQAGDFQLGVSANGNYVLVIGGAGDYYLQLGVKAIPVSGTGVFLNPYGVVNAASSAPFTAQLSPGEFITLYGAGLNDGSAQTASTPFPNTLGGAQVLITPSGATAPLNAPVYYSSATQINAVVPFNIPNGATMVTVQVNNGGTLSNPVQAYLGSTSAGVFTAQNGLGNGAILHADYSLVSTASPARPGETVLVFLTGLGAVAPAIAAGSPAPSTGTLAQVVNTPGVNIDGQPATVAFAGLAPGLGGLYQLNVTIPAAVGSGAVTLEIQALDSDNLQATIPIAQH
jgi:uncharacterized protein (TIGR03437 family)